MDDNKFAEALQNVIKSVENKSLYSMAMHRAMFETVMNRSKKDSTILQEVLEKFLEYGSVKKTFFKEVKDYMQKV